MRARALFLLVALAVGCGSSPERRVTRVIDGERQEGPFVSPFAYEWFIRGEMAFTKGDLHAAREAFRNARTGPQDDTLLIARLAVIEERLGHPGRADALLEEGLSLDPRSLSMWLAQGKIAEARGDLTGAVRAYEMATRIAPTSDEGPRALSRLLERADARERAQAVLERYAEKAGNKTAPGVVRAQLELALARGDAEAAASAVDTLLEVAPARMADIERAANLALSRRRPALAARLLDRIPRAYADPRTQARVLTALGRTSEVEALLEATSPEALGGMVGQAELMLEAGLFERALEVGRAARSVERGPGAELVVGRAALGLGQVATAAEALSAIPKGTTPYVEARTLLADALESAALAPLAAEVASRALAAEDALPLRVAVARARLRMGQLERALDAVSGSGARERLERARLLERTGRFDEASALYGTIDETKSLPENARARVRAEKLAHRGETVKAVSALEAAAERTPEDLFLRRRLAELLHDAGEQARAQAIATHAAGLAIPPALRQDLERLAQP